MENNKIVRELVRLAKSLIAEAYGEPEGLSPSGQQAWETLVNGVENKIIWNVEFKEAKERLSREFEKYSQLLGSLLPGDLRRLLYMVDLNPPSSLVSLPKYLRKVTNFNPDKNRIEDPDFTEFPLRGTSPQRREEIIIDVKIDQEEYDQRVTEIKAFLDESASKLESWVPLIGMLKALKPYIQKGRKLDPSKQKEIYVPPMQSKVSLSRVKNILDGLISKGQSSLEKYFSKTWMETLRTLFKDFRKQDGKDGKVEWGAMNEFFDILPVSWTKVLDYEGKVGHLMKESTTIKPSADKVIKKEAEETADLIAKKFVLKNMNKLTSVIGEKEKNSGAKLIEVGAKSVKFRNGAFEGTMMLDFSDGTGFIVINKVVFSYTMRSMVIRYPTTFHNVRFPDGSVKKMVPEKAMNTVWAKA